MKITTSSTPSPSNYLNFKATIRLHSSSEDPADLQSFLGRNFPINQKYALECVLSRGASSTFWVSSAKNSQEIRDIFAKGC